MNKCLLLILFAVICITACSGLSDADHGQLALSAMTPSPLPHSMKGYELYSWQVGDRWHFTLITGTNRLKTLEEITSDEDVVTPDGWVRISVVGVDAAKGVLVRLPMGEEIFWVGGQRIQTGVISIPRGETINEIQRFCRQLGLELVVSE